MIEITLILVHAAWKLFLLVFGFIIIYDSNSYESLKYSNRFQTVVLAITLIALSLLIFIFVTKHHPFKITFWKNWYLSDDVALIFLISGMALLIQLFRFYWKEDTA